ncbi:hypothetical protein JCM16358_18540 [Halanaerocella petrolearia]
MSKELRLEQVDYQGWQAYKLENKHLSIVVLPQVGGRIISLVNSGQELLYTMPKMKGETFALEEIEDIKDYRRQIDYLPIGGYKTWLAPQSKWHWPPYLDLAVGKYQIDYHQTDEEIEFKLVSPICRETGMQLVRKVALTKDSKRLVVDQEMKNWGLADKKYGLWDVTQVAGEGQVVLPISSEYELENLKETDGKEFVTTLKIEGNQYAVIDCSGQVEFKLGTYFSAGWLLSLVDVPEGRIGYLKRFPTFSEAEFGHGCAVEVFDTYKFDYFEVEVHGPMTNLGQEENTSFSEEWEIYNWDQDIKLEEVIKELA